MGSFTDFLENELGDHLYNAAYSPAATVYLALATADPTDAATGASMNEVANSNAYVRKAITFGAAASRRVTQSGAVTFDQATGTWGTVTHYTVVDSATHGAGNALAHGSLSVSKSVVNGNTPSVANGEVYVEFLANEISTTMANLLLDHAFRNTVFTTPGTVWTGLATAAINDTHTGANVPEVSGGAYARVQVNVNGGAAPAWNLATGGVVDNAGTITFATATASWGTVTGVFTANALTGGTIIQYDNAMADQLVGSADIVRFLPGAWDNVMS